MFSVEVHEQEVSVVAQKYCDSGCSGQRRVHGGYVMFLLVLLEKTMGFTTDLIIIIIIIQSSKERERGREPESCSTISCV